ncbi:hypothetical protein [Streptomyces sp. NPDC001312]
MWGSGIPYRAGRSGIRGRDRFAALAAARGLSVRAFLAELAV